MEDINYKYERQTIPSDTILLSLLLFIRHEKNSLFFGYTMETKLFRIILCRRVRLPTIPTYTQYSIIGRNNNSLYRSIICEIVIKSFPCVYKALKNMVYKIYKYSKMFKCVFNILMKCFKSIIIHTRTERV